MALSDEEKRMVIWYRGLDERGRKTVTVYLRMQLEESISARKAACQLRLVRI